MPEPAPVLELDRVRLSFMTRKGELNVTPGLSLALARGEALGLVGESGSGKSTVAFSIVRYLGPLGRVVSGRILFEGRDTAAMSEAELRAIRGRRIAMVYQDPMSSLNPVMTIGRQLMEVPRLHEGVGEEEARARATAMLAEVNFADPAAIMARYPHQLSGGQQQRIVIAMALIGRPTLLIMDEPTTGLDVTVEAAVLDLVSALRKRHDTALALHQPQSRHRRPGVRPHRRALWRRARRGRVHPGGFRQSAPPLYARPARLPPPSRAQQAREQAQAHRWPGALAARAAAGLRLRAALSPCRAGALHGRSIPSLEIPGEPGHRARCVKVGELASWRPEPGAPGEDKDEAMLPVLLKAEKLAKSYRQSISTFGRSGRSVKALNAVDLVLRRGETLAIVGESGCGKSTFARILSGLEVASAGRVELEGEEIGARRVEARPNSLKRKLQMVFQNPDSTLNPSHRVGYSVARALKRLKGLGAAAAASETRRLFELVSLAPELAERTPQQLSGGQKQRVAIARALAGDPDIVIADEPVSSLDVSVQAAIINLLSELQAECRESLIFISHDLAVVRYLADHVAVMYLGKVVEFGPTDAVFAPPAPPLYRSTPLGRSRARPGAALATHHPRGDAAERASTSPPAAPSPRAARARWARSAIRRRPRSRSSPPGTASPATSPLPSSPSPFPLLRNGPLPSPASERGNHEVFSLSPFRGRGSG